MQENENYAATIAREARKPIVQKVNDVEVLLAPTDYTMHDIEKYMSKPRRKSAKVTIGNTDSFIDYVKRHGSLTDSTVWCDADFRAGNIKLVAIINDHGEKADQQDWRDHTATYIPAYSTEWLRWFGGDGKGKALSQVEFATFIEQNLKDIAGAEGMPSGAQMLEMALNFEANQEMRFKSAMRLQNGAVQISYVENDDDQTLKKMEMFDKFSIGIPVFWAGDSYRIDARLRYRARDGRVNFWYELIRPEQVLEDAAKGLVKQVKDGVGRPLFYGKPV